MHIVLIGPPGCGKGTQSEKIAKRYSLCHISTGDMFRELAKRNDATGKRVRSYIEKGNLVPDAMTFSILKKRLEQKDCRDGFVLDGFPRNVNQAKMLSGMQHIDHVLYLHVPTNVIIKRLSLRAQCRSCGMICGLGKKSKNKNLGTCRKCGGELYQRRDDKAAVVKERVRVYRESTKPLIQYYKSRNLLRKINGDRSEEEVFARIKKILR